MDINATVNFEFIEDNFDSCRGVCLQGSTRSSKTISALQWIIIYCLRNRGKQIVICRDTLTNLRRTTLKDFKTLCYGSSDFEALCPSMKLNKQDMTANINGNSVIFIGLLDDPMRVYGLESDIFYINEAVSTHKHTFNQLNQRCSEGFILDFNPSSPNSWVYQLELRPDVLFFRTTFEDNPFLNEEIVNEIKSYEPTPLNIEHGTADERMWSIYGMGLVFKGKEIIYPNWGTFKDAPKSYDHIFYGLDWGINHPLACVKVWVNGNIIYVKEVLYGSGLIDIDKQVVPTLMKEKLLKDNETYIVCDSSEKKSINTLINNGLPAFGVKKPPGSVEAGIRKVSSFRILVHEESQNIQNELNNYKWKVDNRTDTILDVPVKMYDDALDAIRYVVYTFL